MVGIIVEIVMIKYEIILHFCFNFNSLVLSDWLFLIPDTADTLYCLRKIFHLIQIVKCFCFPQKFKAVCVAQFPILTSCPSFIFHFSFRPKIQCTVNFLQKCGWWRGVVGSVFRLKRSYSTPGLVSTAMGDCLWAGKPFRCEACQLGRLSLLPSVGW